MSARARAASTLRELGAAPLFLDLYARKRPPAPLLYCLRVPDYFFSLEPPLECELVPLLDDGSADSVTFFDPATREIVTKDLEDFDDEVERLPSWQAFLASVLITMLENFRGTCDPAAVAALLGSEHLADVEAFVAMNVPAEEYEARRAAFLARL